jgi:hypothetical protein
VQVRQPRKLKEAVTDMLSVATYLISSRPLFPRGVKTTVYNGAQLAEQRPPEIKEAANSGRFFNLFRNSLSSGRGVTPGRFEGCARAFKSEGGLHTHLGWHTRKVRSTS